MKTHKLQPIPTILIIAFLSCTATFADDPATAPVSPGAIPATPATPATPPTDSSSAVPAVPATPAIPPSETPPGTVIPDTETPQPNSSDSANRPQISDEIKKAIEEAKKQRLEYQTKRAELLKGLRSSDSQGREEIRAKLRENRELFLAQQRENRVELRKQIAELKSSLAEHREVVEEAREKIKTRKGGEE